VETFWLTVANIVLAAAVIAAVAGVATGVLCELVGKWKKRHAEYAELDRDMKELFPHSRPRP